MKTIHILLCWRAGTVEYPIAAFVDQERADIACGMYNRTRSPLVKYRVTEIPIDPPQLPPACFRPK